MKLLLESTGNQCGDHWRHRLTEEKKLFEEKKSAGNKVQLPQSSYNNALNLS
jgi:hypothetical protein